MRNLNIFPVESKNKNLGCKVASSSGSEKYKLLGTHSYLWRRLFQFPELSGHRTHASLIPSDLIPSGCRFIG